MAPQQLPTGSSLSALYTLALPTLNCSLPVIVKEQPDTKDFLRPMITRICYLWEPLQKQKVRGASLVGEMGKNREEQISRQGWKHVELDGISVETITGKEVIRQ